MKLKHLCLSTAAPSLLRPKDAGRTENCFRLAQSIVELRQIQIRSNGPGYGLQEVHGQKQRREGEREIYIYMYI